MPAQTVIRIDPATGASEVRSFDTVVACLASSDGGLVAGTGEGFAFLPDEGGYRLLDEKFQGRDHRMNDATTDAKGRFIAGSMSTPPDAENPDGELWCLGRKEGMIDELLVPNGLAISPDQSTLYISDSHPSVQTVWRCSYDVESGAIGPREAWIDFHDLPGRPDGATMDIDGGYWIASIDGGRVCRFLPDGTLDAVVEVPAAKTTKPVFGGNDRKTMFITTANVDGIGGELYAVDLPWSGVETFSVRLDQRR
ncbi:SMP-30/gluconolactonase/LRE family protein (plasmid) [Falsihalocynthiibacter sp. SS001]|uniref:SMP-30/gluconolactonase/LRE family protein n=1 Tax=Falsihalocynthiibacter sp. SS001 TaxID=3349698 RepID=UPI0036D223A3